jgi:hypothetical protein
MGIRLGRPVERSLQFTGLVIRGGNSHRHSPNLSLCATRGRSSGPSHHPWFCCPAGSSGTTAASDALPARAHFPGSPVIGHNAPTAALSAGPPGRGGPPQFPPPPSDRSTPHTPGSSSGLRFQALHPFHGLHPDGPGSALPLSRLPTGTFTTRQASLHAADRPIASPAGLATLGFDPARFQTEPPACYRASWQLPGRDSHPLATASFCWIRSPRFDHLQTLRAPRSS